jgi:hypothetical protein
MHAISIEIDQWKSGRQCIIVKDFHSYYTYSFKGAADTILWIMREREIIEIKISIINNGELILNNEVVTAHNDKALDVVIRRWIKKHLTSLIN